MRTQADKPGTSAASVDALRQDEEPVRKTVRRLRWFKTSFNEQVEQTAEEKGLVFEIDEQKQAAAFID